MEDQSSSPQQDKPTAAPPVSPGVMDVHRPKSAPPEQSEPVAHQPEPLSSGAASLHADEPPSPAPEPAASSPHPPDSHHLLAAHAGKSRGPALAIVLAVVVALALAAVATYAYLQSNKPKTEDHTNHTSTQQETEATPDTEIDAISKDIDQLPTTADDNKDLPESDLTDQALGI